MGIGADPLGRDCESGEVAAEVNVSLVGLWYSAFTSSGVPE